MENVGLDGFCSPFFVCQRQDMPSLAARGPYKASAACDSPIDLLVFGYADSGSMQWNLNDKDNRSRRHKRVGRPSRTSGRENGREGSGRRQARLAKEVGCTHHCTAAFVDFHQHGLDRHEHSGACPLWTARLGRALKVVLYYNFRTMKFAQGLQQ